MKKLLLPGIKRTRRTKLLMTAILTILALLASGLPSRACHCCAASENIGNVRATKSVAHRCADCCAHTHQSVAQTPPSSASHNPHRPAGHSCCEQLQHSCNCHPNTIFAVELNVENAPVSVSEAMSSGSSTDDQFRGTALGDAFYDSRPPQPVSTTVLLCRMQL